MTQQALMAIQADFRFPANYNGIVIRFDNAWAWGNDTTGALVCLGREQDVKRALANEKLRSWVPEIDQIIELERTLIREEQENNGKQPNLQRPGAFRSRTTGEVKRRKADIRRDAFRKRIPSGAVKR